MRQRKISQIHDQCYYDKARFRVFCGLGTLQPCKTKEALKERRLKQDEEITRLFTK